MKIYLSTQTIGELGFEIVEIRPRFEDNRKSAPAHHILSKGLRIANALTVGGTEAIVVIVPESAAEVMNLTAKGSKIAKMIWHFNDVKESASKEKAIRKWTRLIT